MGKNFSRNNASGQRKERDSYSTPVSMLHQFLNVYTEWKDGKDKIPSVLEPASGNGALVHALKKHVRKVVARDIEQGHDFLKHPDTQTFDYIITNPPYSLATAFTHKARKVATKGFAFLLPLTYLQGKTRFDTIYSSNSYRLEHVYVFTRFPMLGDPIHPDGRYRTGMQAYAWFVWNHDFTGRPTIHWLDNDHYVMRAVEWREWEAAGFPGAICR